MVCQGPVAAARKLGTACVLAARGDLYVTYLEVCLCALHSCVQGVRRREHTGVSASAGESAHCA